MKTKDNLTLIEGKYNLEEAKDILMDLFNSKIKFHQHKNFSSFERFGKEDKNSLKRIDELKESIKIIQNKLSDVKSNSCIHINSSVNINIMNE